jgi:hypothetical protein
MKMLFKWEQLQNVGIFVSLLNIYLETIDLLPPGEHPIAVK